MKTFIIEARKINEHYLPAQLYGYTAIEAIEYNNWFRRNQEYNYIIDTDCAKNFKISGVKDLEYSHLDYLKKYTYQEYVPIGSVEYVLTWLKLMGVNDVKPLNIPEELWKLCNREIKYADNLLELNGEWMVKDRNRIKSFQNEALRLPQNKQGNYFVTQWVDDVISEWRVFVLDKKVKGIRCYSGDEWVMPNRDYIQEAVNIYDKRCYTLDVMVCGNKRHTEIVELHDFFACGLYGFEDYTTLLMMWITAINELLPVKKRS